MDLSIIVINWNTRDLLSQCLRSVFGVAVGCHFEIIVVDNASADGSPQMVEADFPQVLLLKNSTNRGFAAANNQGIERAQGEFILLLNPDTIVLPGALDRLVEFSKAHPDAGAVGGKLLNHDGTLQVSCGHFPTLLNMATESLGLSRLFPHNRLFARFKMTYWNHDAVREVDQPQGAHLCFRRAVLDQVGLLDERFFMYFEEVDLCLRIRNAGWRIYFTPDSQIIHLGGQSSLQNLDARITERYRSLLLFFEKHHSRTQVLCLRALLLCEMSWRLLLFNLGRLRRGRGASPLEVSRRYARVIALCLRGR
jgi:GT2 family glycosyltransferase